MTSPPGAAVARAVELAERAHRGQTRRGGWPYIAHPREVAEAVAQVTGDEDVLCAAWLHDVVEDSAVSLSDLTRMFGRRVSGIVGELTDRPEWEALDTLERKARQRDEFEDASAEAKTVKIADQWSNVRSLARGTSGDTVAFLAGYLATSRAVVEVCRDAAPMLAERFDAAAQELEKLIEERRDG